MIDGHTSRTHFYVSMQQPGIVCALSVLPNDTLEVQGQRVRAQPDSFWSYYPGDVGIFCKVRTCICVKFQPWKYFYCRVFLKFIYSLFREQQVGTHNILV